MSWRFLIARTTCRAAEREWTERNATDWRTPVENFWLCHSQCVKCCLLNVDSWTVIAEKKVAVDMTSSPTIRHGSLTAATEASPGRRRQRDSWARRRRTTTLTRTMSTTTSDREWSSDGVASTVAVAATTDTAAASRAAQPPGPPGSVGTHLIAQLSAVY